MRRKLVKDIEKDLKKYEAAIKLSDSEIQAKEEEEEMGLPDTDEIKVATLYFATHNSAVIKLLRKRGA
jgi:hypothetical protein